MQAKYKIATATAQWAALQAVKHMQRCVPFQATHTTGKQRLRKRNNELALSHLCFESTKMFQREGKLFHVTPGEIITGCPKYALLWLSSYYSACRVKFVSE